MAEIDWTQVITQLGSTTGLIGVIGTVAVAWIYTRKAQHPKADETRAVKEVSTPASPGAVMHDAEAYDLARLAMKKANDLSGRLTLVEEELVALRPAYKSLYGWGRKLRRDWMTVRELTEAPPFPEDVHHPS